MIMICFIHNPDIHDHVWNSVIVRNPFTLFCLLFLLCNILPQQRARQMSRISFWCKSLPYIVYLHEGFFRHYIASMLTMLRYNQEKPYKLKAV